jgi:hypothetical protein
MELKLNVEYVRDLLDYLGRTFVRKAMKRFEVIEDRNVLKGEMKELIYEEIRNIRNLLIASGEDSKHTIWKFNNIEKDK